MLCSLRAKLSDQFPGDRRRELVDACVGQMYGLGQIGCRDVFEQIPTGSRLERLDDVFLIVKGGEHQDLACWQLPPYLRRRADAIHNGHAHIHQNDVGRQG